MTPAGIVLAIALLTPAISIAQSPLQVDDAQARQNLIQLVAPVYPPIAQAAHVAGDVSLQVEIGTDGHVRKAIIVSGPEMLRYAALEAAKQWTFTPFLLDGQPSAAIARIIIPFKLPKLDDPKDLKTAREYFPLSDQCHTSVARNVDPAEQAKACQAAAAKADEFAPDARFIERRSAYVFNATALMRNKEFAAAVTSAEKAVAVTKDGHDDASGIAAAYGTLGQAQALAGDLNGANLNLGKAEDSQRIALASPAGKDLHTPYSATLKMLLTWHSKVLKALGNPEAAAEKSSEAERY